MVFLRGDDVALCGEPEKFIVQLVRLRTIAAVEEISAIDGVFLRDVMVDFASEEVL